MLRYVLLIGAVAGVAAYFLVLKPDLGKTEESLGAIASQIAGRPVSVNCQGVVSSAVDTTGNEGSVKFDASGRPADVAKLKRGVCTELEKFPDMLDDDRLGCLTSGQECPSDIERLVVAVHVLTHESWHLRGIKDERVAGCYALQTEAAVATRLGASPGLARAVAVYYTNEKYTRLSSEYTRLSSACQTPACRNGGKYDLNRGSNIWP